MAGQDCGPHQASVGPPRRLGGQAKTPSSASLLTTTAEGNWCSAQQVGAFSITSCRYRQLKESARGGEGGEGGGEEEEGEEDPNEKSFLEPPREFHSGG